jgi:hypothetical protein
VRRVVQKKSPDIGKIPSPESTHPLPWRNQPSDGLNHVADANGRPVYDGSDAAEMFRLYSAEAQAEQAGRLTARHAPGSGPSTRPPGPTLATMVALGSALALGRRIP